MRGASEAWSELERAGGRSVRHPWVGTLARAGYVAKGAVYAVIGVLALRLALGEGGRTTDTKGALATVAQAPLGGALVAALALGLVGMALWFEVQAFADPDGERRQGAWAILSRVGQGIAGLGYASLALAAVRLAFGEGAGRGGDAAARSWTARVLELPAGRALVFAGAAIVIFLGARQIWNAVGGKFLKHVELTSAGRWVRRWAPRLGAIGFVTQGLVFVLVGLFFGQAAFERDPREATGLDGALETLARQPFGQVLLGLAALGLLAYAAFAVVEGRYRRIRGG
ncbi:DUF1206 domain-containing protein [Anaeromyxobacter sp. Fw109-5]|uniref:DUF1206 domain-containing protein n=1 Tax=Anaeromyxobacter sp. (strain Fw109-5) TaxID=404589 RepID=UPI000158A43F|nr:DUF1206 domain-containing protein [Anaeromyxobacter sp. Fw109-5]ABS26108.1 protein of unknown function DUF1206 [Anaeromyxobacter sp. Fw109-5]